MTRNPIQITVTAGDNTLEAVLRLLATQGAILRINKFEWSYHAAEVGGCVVIPPAKSEPAEPLTLDPEAFIAAAAPVGASQRDLSPLVITAPEADAPPAEPDGLDVQPADDDAAYRGSMQSPAATFTEADAQSLIVDRLAANPHLADVCTKLLRPLAQRGFGIDGDREAFLTRTANEFADYRTTHYAKAATLLLKGRHVFFPETAEIYAALGKAARLEATTTKAAA